MTLEDDLRAIIRDEVTAAVAAITDALTARPVDVDVPTAARLLSTSERTVQNLTRTGRLPVLDLGIDRTLIPVAALEDLARTAATTSGTSPPSPLRAA